MLKKIFVTALLMATFIFSSNVCNAMPEIEMSLGGVGTYANAGRYRVKPLNSSAVRNMYGEPTSIVMYKYYNDYGYMWRYGDSVEIYFNRREDEIGAIKVTANNGWKTPRGLGVGMKIEDAERMYGKPFNFKTVGDKVVYIYGGDATPDLTMGIVFDKNSHQILKLCIHVYGYPNYEGFQWMLE